MSQMASNCMESYSITLVIKQMQIGTQHNITMYHHVLTEWLCVGVENPNSGPYACTENTLVTKPSPQLHLKGFLIANLFYAYLLEMQCFKTRSECTSHVQIYFILIFSESQSIQSQHLLSWRKNPNGVEF